MLLLLERLASDHQIHKNKMTELIGASSESASAVDFLIESGFAKDAGDRLMPADRLKDGISAQDIEKIQDFVLGADFAGDFRRLMNYLSSNSAKPAAIPQLEDGDLGVLHLKKKQPSPEVLKKYVKSFIDVSDIVERQKPKKGGDAVK